MNTHTGYKAENEGFSLVEVLVAMTVLALVVIPMAALFSNSVRMNMVSKHRMNAITLAEDIMESIKSNDIGNICYQFQYPADFDMVSLAADTIADDSTNPGQVLPKMVSDGFGGTVVAKDSNGNPIFNFKPNDTGDYKFSLTGVEVQQDREKYDAVISMKASGYKTPVGGTRKIYEYNSAQLVKIAAVKGDENLVAVRTKDDDDNTLVNVLAEAAADGHSGLTESEVKRTFIVQIDSAEAASTTVEYKDSFGYVTKTYALNTFEAKTKEEESEDSGEEGGEGEGEAPEGGAGAEPAVGEKIPLENVFVFYTPNYYSKGSASNKDTFVINNNSGKEINVYIVKQEAGNYTGLDVDEKQYRAAVNVVNGSGSTTRIMTNLNYNLAHDYDDSVDAEIIGTTISGPASFTINGAVPPSEAIKNNKLWIDLADTSSKDRFYDVTIDVYRTSDTGHTDPVYSLTGSTQE